MAIIINSSYVSKILIGCLCTVCISKGWSCNVSLLLLDDRGLGMANFILLVGVLGFGMEDGL